VTLKLRDHRFATHLRQRSIGRSTDDHARVFELARTLWRELWNGDPVRLLGVSVSGLERASGGSQVELFGVDDRATRLRAAMDRVRDQLGEAVLVPAGSLSYRRALGHVTFGPVTPKKRNPASGAEPGSARPSRDTGWPDPTARKPKLTPEAAPRPRKVRRPSTRPPSPPA
jgi:hypothetical protein